MARGNHRGVKNIWQEEENWNGRCYDSRLSGDDPQTRKEKMKTLRQITGVILFAAAFQGLMAVPLGYDIGGASSVSANSTDPGLVISTSLSAGLSSVAFTLNDGQSSTFAFFNIWTNEGSVESDDTASKPISAYLDFAVPMPNSGTTVDGETYGVRTGFLGNIQYGQLVWDGPVIVTASDREFVITLSNEVFNYGELWGTGCKGATVEATVTQRSSSVPEASATLSLLGLGMLAIAGFRRFFSC